MRSRCAHDGFKVLMFASLSLSRVQFLRSREANNVLCLVRFKTKTGKHSDYSMLNQFGIDT